MSGTLVLVRHGQSEWNLKNLFTGWKDPDLTELGIEEAKTGAKALKDAGLKFDVAFTSVLIRAQRTLDLIMEGIGQTDLEVIRAEWKRMAEAYCGTPIDHGLLKQVLK